jgi:hypothetical protein
LQRKTLHFNGKRKRSWHRKVTLGDMQQASPDRVQKPSWTILIALFESGVTNKVLLTFSTSSKLLLETAEIKNKEVRKWTELEFLKIVGIL